VYKRQVQEVLHKFPNQKYIIGDATQEDILNQACIEKAKGIFAATNDDNTNLVICLLSRRLNPNIKIVSLCSNFSNEFNLKLAGADCVISPNYMSGIRMASEMIRPAVTHFFDIMLSDKYKSLRIEQIELKGDHVGKELGDLRLKEFKDTIIIALQSKDELIFKPEDSYKVCEGDLILTITTPQERIKLESMFS
jgi:voltage-gated potassium channel